MHPLLVAVLTEVAITFGAPNTQPEDYQLTVEQHCCHDGCTACNDPRSLTERCDISFPTYYAVVVSTKRNPSNKSFSSRSSKTYHNQQGQLVHFETSAAVIKRKSFRESNNANAIIPSQEIREFEIGEVLMDAPAAGGLKSSNLASEQFEQRGAAIPARRNFCCLQGCTRCRGPCGCSSEDDWPWASCCALAIAMKRDENGSTQYVNQNSQAAQFVGENGILRSTPNIKVVGDAE